MTTTINTHAEEARAAALTRYAAQNERDQQAYEAAQTRRNAQRAADTAAVETLRAEQQARLEATLKERTRATMPTVSAADFDRLWVTELRDRALIDHFATEARRTRAEAQQRIQRIF